MHLYYISTKVTKFKSIKNALYYSKPTEIHCVRNNKLRAALDPIVALQAPPININFSNPQEHVPEADKTIDS